MPEVFGLSLSSRERSPDLGKLERWKARSYPSFETFGFLCRLPNSLKDISLHTFHTLASRYRPGGLTVQTSNFIRERVASANATSGLTHNQCPPVTALPCARRLSFKVCNVTFSVPFCTSSVRTNSLAPGASHQIVHISPTPRLQLVPLLI